MITYFFVSLFSGLIAYQNRQKIASCALTQLMAITAGLSLLIFIVYLLNN